MNILIVVDMQKGFINNEKLENLVKKINSLIKSSNYDKIIFTKFINKNDDTQSMYIKWLSWYGLIDEDSQKIVVDIPKNSLIWEKYGYGIPQKQINYLKKLDITQIDICGIETDACINAICFNLFDNGIYPNVLINYTSSPYQEDAKKFLIRNFGKVDEKK